MKRLGIVKYLATYMVAAAIVAGAIFAGATIQSKAESYIRYDNIIIRDSANGEILGGIAKGTEVEVVESATGTDGKQWNHVKYAANGTTHEGWVRADLMTEDRSLVEPDEQPQAQQPQEQEPQQQENTPAAEPEEEEPLVDGELEVVIPLAEVSGEGYKAAEDKSFLICNKSMTIASDFSEDAIPADFEKCDIVFNGETVKGVSYKYGDVSLIYLKDESGQGEFFVLDEQRQAVHSYIRIFADSNSLILLVPPEDMSVASSYDRTLYAADEDTAVVAYQFSQQSELMDIGTNVAEYFYVYGVSKNGVPDWYLVDEAEGTFIRATADLAVELDALSGAEIVVQPMEEEGTLEKMIIVVMAAIILILFIMVIVFGVRSFRARRDYYEEDDYEEEELSFIQKRREERKYRRFMENFEEEGDEDVEDLLPRKKVEAYLKETEEELEEVVSETVQPQDAVVLPPVDTVILKEIMAEQELEAKVQEPEVPEEGADEAVSKVLERAVALEMPMDDYDIDVSDEEDFDLTDDNSEADEKEYDEIEKILLAGLAELEAEKGSKEPKKEILQEDEVKDTTKDQEETNEEEKDDEWKDLEFLDI